MKLVMSKAYGLAIKFVPRVLLPVSPLAILTLIVGICLGCALLLIMGRVHTPDISLGWVQTLVQLFEDGGLFMYPIFGIFFVGIGFIVERLSYFKKLTSNDVDLSAISAAIKKGGINAVDSFEFHDGPLIKYFRIGRANKDEPEIKNVESSLDNTARIERSSMERGLTWISLCVATAPMLGFLGTVWGMIQAFNDIKIANDLSPAVVAGGISVALLTTAFGLIVAIILQLFQCGVLHFIDSQICNLQKGTTAILNAVKRVEETEND